MRDAAIFDMDGTLCDTSSIEHLIRGENKDFAAFHAASRGCPPHPEVVRAAVAQHEQGRAVLVVTSREFVWRDLTLDWLVEHGVPYYGLYLRIVGDYCKDVVIKTDILRQVRDDGFQVVEAWEDKPAIAELWRDNGVVVHVVG